MSVLAQAGENRAGVGMQKGQIEALQARWDDPRCTPTASQITRGGQRGQHLRLLTTKGRSRFREHVRESLRVRPQERGKRLWSQSQAKKGCGWVPEAPGRADPTFTPSCTPAPRA